MTPSFGQRDATRSEQAKAAPGPYVPQASSRFDGVPAPPMYRELRPEMQVIGKSYVVGEGAQSHQQVTLSSRQCRAQQLCCKREDIIMERVGSLARLDIDLSRRGLTRPPACPLHAVQHNKKTMNIETTNQRLAAYCGEKGKSQRDIPSPYVSGPFEGPQTDSPLQVTFPTTQGRHIADSKNTRYGRSLSRTPGRPPSSCVRHSGRTS